MIDNSMDFTIKLNEKKDVVDFFAGEEKHAYQKSGNERFELHLRNMV